MSLAGSRPSRRFYTHPTDTLELASCFHTLPYTSGHCSGVFHRRGLCADVPLPLRCPRCLEHSVTDLPRLCALRVHAFRASATLLTSVSHIQSSHSAGSSCALGCGLVDSCSSSVGILNCPKMPELSFRYLYDLRPTVKETENLHVIPVNAHEAPRRSNFVFVALDF